MSNKLVQRSFLNTNISKYFGISTKNYSSMVNVNSMVNGHLLSVKYCANIIFAANTEAIFVNSIY